MKRKASKGSGSKSTRAPGPSRAKAKKATAAKGSEHRWTFLSNHAHVLICLAQDPDLRLRDVAERIGITERAVQGILTDLEAEGLVRRYREGRRNTYELSLNKPLRHPIEKHRKVGDLVKLIID